MADTKIVGGRTGKQYNATITGDGCVPKSDGETYRTLSAASNHLTQFSNNGWEFWQIASPSDKRTISEVRSAYLASSDYPSDDNSASTDVSPQDQP